ncbi:MAG: hypothetical protein K9M11_04660 [Candidatus Pacebacteria bacterium]|nr:hypothetical protein [Candidatus Paceibacterota bacterium]
MKTLVHLLSVLAFATLAAPSCTMQKTVPISSDRSNGLLDNVHIVDNDNIREQQRIVTGSDTKVLPILTFTGQ